MPARIRAWRRSDAPPLLLPAAFLLVGLLYVWATPVMEASDEPHHFAFAEYISRTRSLPVQVPGQLTAWAQEGSQPPLYYILVAALIAPLDTGDLTELMRPNPHAIVGDPAAVNNKNRFLHDPAGPELAGAALALYVARLFSLALSAGSVLCVWLAARELGLQTGCNPHRLALPAAALVAFNPQFLFNSASVNNDNLITLLAGLIIWQLLVILRHGLSPRRALILALLLALASLSKLGGLLLYAPAGLTALWLTRRSGDWKGLARLVVLAGLCWLVIAGPWYARNLELYGEFTGTQTMLDIFGRRPAPSLASMLDEEFRGLRYSYWGIFGAFNIFSPAPFYIAMDLVTLAGAAGLALWLWGKRRARNALPPVSLLALCVALFAGALVVWTLQTAASTGRLLFPVSAASASLLALGLLRLRLPGIPALLALAAVSVLMPFLNIRPAYFAPAQVEQLPADATELALFYEDTELAGYHLPEREYGPGDTIPVTLYWRPLRPSELNFSFYVHLLNDAGRVLVRNYGFPGGGSLETSRWQPGVIHEDRWQLPIPESARGDTPLRVQIGWWKYPEDYHLRARKHENAIVDPVLLAAGSFSDGGRGEQFPLKHAVWPLDFGESIRLLAREQDGAVISLLWETLAPPRPDLQVFLHVLNNPLPGEPEVMVAQGDSAPSTPSADWQPGRRYLTRHRLEATAATEPGDYLVRVGWYSMADGQRLWADCDFNACPLARIRLPAGAAAP